MKNLIVFASTVSGRILLLVAFVLSIGIDAHSAPKPADTNEFAEQPLDGVKVEALEVYRNPRATQFTFGVGLWPLNAYYNALSVDLGYTRFFSSTWAFELRGSYVYTVDKSLASELADRYQTAPVKIERLSAVVAPSLQYVLLYGKFIFLKEHVRYFRSSFLAGPAIVLTNQRTTFGAQLGMNFETYVNDTFSWKFEIRDTIASGGDNTNNLSFNIGTAYAF